jgi:hypothetical protein
MLYWDLSITGGYQQFDKDLSGLVGVVGSFWMAQSQGRLQDIDKRF